MIVGDPNYFAIESEMTAAFIDDTYKALGYFCVHIGGVCFGIKKSCAAHIGFAYISALGRIEYRGRHICPAEYVSWSGYKIAYHIWAEYFLDLPPMLKKKLITQGFSTKKFGPDIEWDDLDSGLDDSRLYQFDIGDKVRLIGHKFTNCKIQFGQHQSKIDRKTLRDIWIPADVYYDTLQEWADKFYAEWQDKKRFVPYCLIGNKQELIEKQYKCDVVLQLHYLPDTAIDVVFKEGVATLKILDMAADRVTLEPASDIVLPDFWEYQAAEPYAAGTSVQKEIRLRYQEKLSAWWVFIASGGSKSEYMRYEIPWKTKELGIACRICYPNGYRSQIFGLPYIEIR
jgi:hypothetical protein